MRRLKEWRSEKAKELGWPPYMVFTDKHLMTFISHKINRKEDFGPIKGFGPKKIQRFGEGILGIIQAFLTEEL